MKYGHGNRAAGGTRSIHADRRRIRYARRRQIQAIDHQRLPSALRRVHVGREGAASRVLKAGDLGREFV